MPRLNEVTADDIERLNPTALTILLWKLLSCEFTAHNLPLSGVAVGAGISVPDGGEDGRARWQDGLERTDWLPNRYTIFQSKATKLGPEDCKKEVLHSDRSDLKEQVKAAFEAQGAYVLFYGRRCNQRGCEARIKKIRKALSAVRKPYAETAEIHVYPAEKIAEWTNKFVACVTFVAERSGLVLPLGTKSWSQWSAMPEHQAPYVSNSLLNSYTAQIREGVTGVGSVARVDGLSGLGKTRLVLEAFRPEGAEQSVKISSDCLVYLDAAMHGNLVQAFVADLCNRRLEGIVVVDNCPLALHRALSAEVRRSDSRLRLITLDFTSENLDSETPTIRLERQQLEDVVRQLLVDAFPQLQEHDRVRIERFAQGFPQIAVLLARATIRGESNIGALNDSELLNKLLWGRGPSNEEGQKVIEACSIFAHLGIAGDAEKELRFVAEKVCHISPQDFYASIQQFVERGVCQQAGDYIYVTPKPLALQLAAQWWKKCLPSAVPPLLTELATVGLDTALCDQISHLDFLPKARELTAELCGQNRPFGQAEVLTTEQGSRLFRSFVEVNPQATAEAVARVFGGFDREELLRITGHTRRNLVVALEKLCFWAETFPLVAPILLKFAAAETESWKNNATGQFEQLYHIALPGTQAALQPRLMVVEHALKSGDEHKRRIAVEALGCALESTFFSRSSGVETQGSRISLEDYEAKGSEIVDYWARAADLLTTEAEKGGSIGDLAMKRLAETVRGLLANGQVQLVENAITRILASRKSWPDGVSAVRQSLKYDGKNFSDAIRAKLQDLLTRLEPRSLSGRLRSIISIPDWDMEMEEVEPGKYMNVAEQNAIALADEVSDSGESWFPHLEVIFNGEQRQGFAFGRRLAEKGIQPEPFIAAALDVLRKIAPEKRSMVVLAGFLAAQSDRAIVARTLETVSRDEQIGHLLLDLTRLSRPTREDLDRVLQQLAAGKASLEKLRLFAFGRALHHLNPDEIASFAQAIAAYGVPWTATAFYIVFMYCVGTPERWPACRSLMLNFVNTEGLLDEVATLSNLMGDSWEQVAIKLLQEEPRRPELARHLAEEIVRCCGKEEFNHIARFFVQPVLGVLLERYLEDVWPIVGAALLSGDFITADRLKHLLGDLFNKESGAFLLSRLPLDFLRRWCDENGTRAARLIAGIVPVLVREENEPLKWHPIALMVLDNFGDEDAVLADLSSNLFTFSWSGSLVPFFEQQVQLMKQLSEHPKVKVRQWSINEIQWLDRQIEHARKADAEEAIGIVRGRWFS